MWLDYPGKLKLLQQKHFTDHGRIGSAHFYVYSAHINIGQA